MDFVHLIIKLCCSFICCFIVRDKAYFSSLEPSWQFTYQPGDLILGRMVAKLQGLTKKYFTGWKKYHPLSRILFFLYLRTLLWKYYMCSECRKKYVITIPSCVFHLGIKGGGFFGDMFSLYFLVPWSCIHPVEFGY